MTTSARKKDLELPPVEESDDGINVGADDLAPGASDGAEGAAEIGVDEELIDAPENNPLFKKQKECLLLLLQARKALASMVTWQIEKVKKDLADKAAREEEERKRRGLLDITEIQRILKSQPGDDDTDFGAEIQELKRNLVIEIRRNHMLDRDLAKLDRRIALLIKNRDSLQEVLASTRGLRSQRGKATTPSKANFTSDPRKVEFYQELFYLLQTEPKYLAKCLYMVHTDQMDSFLDTTILTLYGDAFSPREEFLILRLFQLAIQHEISSIKNVGDFLQAESVIPKMVVAYNRRKQGNEYLRSTLEPILDKVIDRDDLNLELNPLLVYQNMIAEQEVRTGQKSELDRNIPEEKAAANPEVQALIKKRQKDLQDICQLFLDGIISSMPRLPYGLRWICKQIRIMCEKALPESSPEDILRLTGYFVYYRFVNLAIVTPDAFNVIDKDMPPQARKNLVIVAKVLQNLFNLKLFSKQERTMLHLNDFIAKNKEMISQYFNSLVGVGEPEDVLQINRYMELTQKSKPVILISLHEIASTHQMLAGMLEKMAPEKDDPLRLIMNDLGAPPEDVAEDDDREIQLTLTNRFKVDVEEEAETTRIYAETKELLIPVLRTVPIETTIQRLNLMDVLESGIKYATETANKQLGTQINKILENIQKLEAEGLVTRDDNYESFVHDVALEVANRASIREHQKKEIQRLTRTLEDLRAHQAYVQAQITDYTKYLQDAREKHYQPRKKKRGKKGAEEQPTMLGPIKFSYKELAKKGVIVDSEVPELLRKTTSFLISSETPGVIDIVARVGAKSIEKMELELDDLLERHYNNIERLELDQVTLDVSLTISLINKQLLKK